MSEDEGAPSGLRDRIARQGEDALGKLAQELLENPLVNSAIAKAFEARERAVQAQETAMGALNIPSAADIERLTRDWPASCSRPAGWTSGSAPSRTSCPSSAWRSRTWPRRSTRGRRPRHASRSA